MKKRKTQPDSTRAAAAGRQAGAAGGHAWRGYAGAALGAFAVLFTVYGPALNAPFVFDDLYLPFTDMHVSTLPFRGWVGGVRPLLMATYWLNYRISELQPYSYHLFNVLMHFVTGCLIFLAVRRLLSWASVAGAMREILGAFAALLFLFHPLQTESVSYIASRSETLSVMFFYGAFALFLYRRSQAISWPVAVGVLALFGAAVSTKEHAAALPALLLLTDWYWNPGFSFAGIRRNWRLYAPLALGTVLAARTIWNVLRTTDSAGFSSNAVTWYEYFFTQCRAIWVYIRLFLLPYGQNIDWKFPFSHTLFDRGAAIGLLALVALAVAAFMYRRRFPLASYGVFAFLILLAPTSSFVPIADALAERRVYLPFTGLLLVAAEFLRRWKTPRHVLAGTLAAVVVLAAALTYSRNQVWASDLSLWQDSVAKTPANTRARFQLAMAYFNSRQCEAALGEFEHIARLMKPDYRLLLDWGLAYDCLNRYDEALAKIQAAVAMQRTGHALSLLGMLHFKQNRHAEALQDLDAAVQLDPGLETGWIYRGNVHIALGEPTKALADYRQALAVNPASDSARQGMVVAESRLKMAH